MIDRLVPLADWGQALRYHDPTGEPGPTPEEIRGVLADIRQLAFIAEGLAEARPPAG